jgi:UDP-2-acetamido-3-amino-2,3-dideoxy-glucuronate N-acetyltransferase
VDAPLIHSSAICDEGCVVGAGTRIWHFCHIMAGARIGRACSLGQNCFVASGVQIGDGVRLQNNVSVYEGVTLADDVFCGPGVVFTNVEHPRSAFPSKPNFSKTSVGRGATLGANCTIVAGITLGEYCFVGAGAVVTADVAPFALVLGVPARWVGWVSVRAHRLAFDEHGSARCPVGGERYLLRDGVVNLMDQ